MLVFEEVHTLILLDASLEPTGACWGLGGICWFCRWGKSDISNSKFSGGKAEAALGGGDWSELLVGVGDGTGAVAILVVLGLVRKESSRASTSGDL